MDEKINEFERIQNSFDYFTNQSTGSKTGANNFCKTKLQPDPIFNIYRPPIQNTSNRNMRKKGRATITRIQIAEEYTLLYPVTES